MSPIQMRQILDRTPFQPIEVFVSDGAGYPIRHPEFALVEGTQLHVFLESAEDALPQSYVLITLRQITGIQPL